MPRYRVTLSDGRIVTLEAETAPSEADVLAALDQGVNVGEAATFTVNGLPVGGTAAVGTGPRYVDRVAARAVDQAATQGDVALGALKAAGRTAFELGDVARTTVPTLRVLSDAIMPGAFDRPAAETVPELAYTTPTQELGGAVERVAEFFLPGAAVNRARAAVRGVPALNRAAKLGIEAALEAVPAAAVTALQDEGSPGVAAATAAALPLVGGAGNAAARLQRSAVKSFEQAINPTTRRAKADAARIAAEALRSGVKGSLEDVAQTARRKADVLNDALDRIWTRVGGRITPVRRFTDAIERLKADHLDSLGLPLTPDDARAIGYLTELQASIAEKGPMIDWNDVRRINQSLASDVAAAGGYSEKTGGMFGVNLDDASRLNAKRDVSGVYRKEMAAELPEAAAINKPLSLQIKIAELAEMTRGRKTGQKNLLAKWLPRMTGAAIGTGAGAATGDSGVETALQGIAGAALGGKVLQLVDSPRWHLFSGRAKQRLADALAAGNREAIAAAVGRLFAEEASTRGRGLQAVAGAVGR